MKWIPRAILFIVVKLLCLYLGIGIIEFFIIFFICLAILAFMVGESDKAEK
ncbi:hypothetical protein [Bergeyella sp. RCAD1439]|uniref:hypothetical protein n=1 Tax=Bergeyella anatis TaxID=3113737 RepID=UPI002E19131D